MLVLYCTDAERVILCKVQITLVYPPGVIFTYSGIILNSYSKLNHCVALLEWISTFCYQFDRYFNFTIALM